MRQPSAAPPAGTRSPALPATTSCSVWVANDDLSGLGGSDCLDAGADDDHDDAVDGARDFTDCGPGSKDQATIDSLYATSGCERLDRR